MSTDIAIIKANMQFFLEGRKGMALRESIITHDMIIMCDLIPLNVSVCQCVWHSSPLISGKRMFVILIINQQHLESMTVPGSKEITMQ